MGRTCLYCSGLIKPHIEIEDAPHMETGSLAHRFRVVAASVHRSDATIQQFACCPYS